MTGNIEGGPVVCEQGGTFQCYRPSPANILRVTVLPITKGAGIAAGNYDDTNGLQRPLVALSTNAGSTWTFPSSITEPNTTPAFSSVGNFLGASCSGNTCIATGRYRDTSNTQRPLLGLSTDAGNTWSYPSAITEPSTTPAFSSSGVFVNASCHDSICITGGQYTDTSNTVRPLLALSSNTGATWSFPDDITQPSTTPAFSTNGRLEGSYCDRNICITAGRYLATDGVQRPLLALSSNAGNTWTYPEGITNLTTTPAFSSGGIFFGTNCHNSICIAGGGYTDINTIQRPLLALSTNTGNTWTFPTTITQPSTTPTFSSGGQFIGTNCHGSICVAVGYYTDTSAVRRPLLALTTDAGSTWTYPEDITNLTVTPAFGSNGQLLSASCHDSTCIAVGFYSDINAIRRPLLALSTDTGSTWSFPENMTQPTITPAFSSGNFRGVSCEGNTCFASGTYVDTNTISRPLLAVSADAGKTWAFSNSITEPTTEPAFSSGGLGPTSVQ